MTGRNQLHRRAAAAALLRRRADDPSPILNQLVPRFSPTAIFTEFQTVSETDVPGGNPPTETSPSPEIPTPPTTDVTPTPPTPTPPTTTVTPPPPPTTTEVTPSPPLQTEILPPPQVEQTTSETIQNTPPPRPVATHTSASLLTTTQTFRSVASSAASDTASPPPEPASTTSVGGIVGGLAGGILGLVVIVFVVRYLLRRRSRQDEGEGGVFNPNDFRRSAVMMNDPPTHEDTVNAGYNPRPPTMIERRLASPAPTFGTQYGAPGPHYFDNNGNTHGAADQYGQYQSFAPGQVMNNLSPPQSATSAHPLFQNPAYAQSPFSPKGSPTSTLGPYGSSYDDRGEVIPPPYLTRQPSSGAQLGRQPSAGGHPSYPQDDGSAQYADYPGHPYTPQHNAPYPSDDYVNLDRSSVTPFQAAQYAEISKKLNTEVPGGLDTPAITAFVQHNNLSSLKEENSPFADPASAPPVPAHDAQTSQAFQDAGRPHSVDSAQDFNFPVPPSPAHTNSSRSRVDSAPPTLPEITVESRVSVNSYDFPSSIRGSALPISPLASGFPSGMTAAAHGLHAQSPHGHPYPTTPSPLASSFAMDSPPIGNTFHAGQAAPAPAASSTRPEEKKRPETVYDADDAYGGI